MPVEGQTALLYVGSNCPVTRRGARQPKLAPTLWQPVGNHLPHITIMRASTPVSAEGSSIKFTPPKPPPCMVGSLCQLILKRLSGLTSHRPTFLSAFLTFSGMRAGFCICAKVGINMLRSLARSMACCSRSSCMVRSIMVTLRFYSILGNFLSQFYCFCAGL